MANWIAIANVNDSLDGSKNYIMSAIFPTPNLNMQHYVIFIEKRQLFRESYNLC